MYQPLFTGKADQAAHHMQPGRKGPAAKDAFFFLHFFILLSNGKDARKEK